jgi:hypothetical protein
MAVSVHSEREISNSAIRCQNLMRFELEKLQATAKKYADLDQYLKNQGILERGIKELNGKNAAVRACKKEHEAVMLQCLMQIAAQIGRQNWILGDILDNVASQMRVSGSRDCVQMIANAYHMKYLMVTRPCEATN